MNSIGSVFENLGGIGNDPTSWKRCDLIEANFPKLVNEIKLASSDEAAEKILLDLMDQIEGSQIGTDHEKRRLLVWLDGLRRLPA